MRHGVKDETETLEPPIIGASTISGTQLGCYFCNDVVAPSDVSIYIVVSVEFYSLSMFDFRVQIFLN